ncbi:unnamed protein product [Parajaminaea phylloscopi]
MSSSSGMAASSSSPLPTATPKIKRRPVILVTGANAGLGFATCQRLLLQLSSPCPSDTLPKSTALYEIGEDEPLATPFAAPHGCTIILACRNPIKAHKARRALIELVGTLKALPDQVETPTSADALAKLGLTKPAGAKETLAGREPDEAIRQGRAGSTSSVATATRNTEGASALRRKTPQSGGDAAGQGSPRLRLQDQEARARGRFRRRFCRGTRIEFVPLDLGSFASVLTCAKQVSDRHQYITHLVLNAGGAAWTGLNFPKAIWMMLTGFRSAVTYPAFKMQRSGDLSQDGVGWVWSINVGGSWMLAQALLPLLRRTPYATPSRVIWTSSIEAFRRYYDTQDMQCLRTDVPSEAYESTKFQCELAAVGLDQQLREEGDSQIGRRPHVLLTHPGVIATSIMADFLNWFTSIAMLCTFYIARWLASPHHCIAPYKGAIATCHAALRPCIGPSEAEVDIDAPEHERPFERYGSRCDIWGREYVDIGHIDTWDPLTDGRGQVIAATPGSTDSVPNVRGLAEQWRRRTNEICKKVRRQSDAGELPPARAVEASKSPEFESLVWEQSGDEYVDEEESDVDYYGDGAEAGIGEEWQTVEKVS